MPLLASWWLWSISGTRHCNIGGQPSPSAIAGCSLPYERLVCFGDNVMGSSLEIDESIHPVIKSNFFVFLYGARSAKAVLHRFEGIYLVMDVRKLLLTQPEALRTLGLGDPCCV